MGENFGREINKNVKIIILITKKINVLVSIIIITIVGYK